MAATADKTAGQYVDDSALQTEVKAKLVGDDFMGGMGINTEIRKGVVQLGGWIDNAENGTKAAAVVAGIEGVKEVDNQLHVKRGEASAGQTLDDTVITTKTKSAIGAADLGQGIKINVDTYNGVVLLTGFVDTKEQKAAAGEKAAAVPNVKDVVNGIYVYD
jgi:hyperosmotically inducible protein